MEKIHITDKQFNNLMTKDEADSIDHFRFGQLKRTSLTYIDEAFKLGLRLAICKTSDDVLHILKRLHDLKEEIGGIGERDI